MMKQHLVKIFIIFILACSGCIENYENDFTTVNEKYIVKNIYKGFTNGHTVIVVDYYSGDNILSISNEKYFKGRANSIIMKKSPYNYSYLYLYQINNCPYNSVRYGKNTYPRARYILYEKTEFKEEGLSTHTQHSRKDDDYSFLK